MEVKKALPPEISKGSEIELYLEKLAFGGKALGKVAGMVVFVDHGVPGQKVRLRITRKKAQFAEGRGGKRRGGVPGLCSSPLPAFWVVRGLSMAGCSL